MSTNTIPKPASIYFGATPAETGALLLAMAIRLERSEEIARDVEMLMRLSGCI